MTMLTKDKLDDELAKLHQLTHDDKVRLETLLQRAELAGLLAKDEGMSAEEQGALQGELISLRNTVREAFVILNDVDESILARTDAPTQRAFRDALRLLRGRWTS